MKRKVQGDKLGKYNKDLKNRGDLTIWFTQEVVEKWFEENVNVKMQRKAKRIFRYSDPSNVYDKASI